MLSGILSTPEFLPCRIRHSTANYYGLRTVREGRRSATTRYHKRFPRFIEDSLTLRDSFKALNSSRLAYKEFENCPAPGTKREIAAMRSPVFGFLTVRSTVGQMMRVSQSARSRFRPNRFRARCHGNISWTRNLQPAARSERISRLKRYLVLTIWLPPLSKYPEPAELGLF